MVSHTVALRVHAYVAVVSVSGLAALVLLVAGWHEASAALTSPRLWLLAAFVVIGELAPIRVPRGAEAGRLTTSTTFAFALLLDQGAAPAALALAIASATADIRQQVPWWRTTFNVAVYTLALAAAAAVIAGLLGAPLLGPQPPFATADLPAIAVGAAAFFAANMIMVGLAIAIFTGASLTAFFRRELPFQAASSALLLALAPVVVAAADRSLLLVPALGGPLVAAYLGSKFYADREYQALHDRLTDLPNREHFSERVADAVAADEPAAVMILDLDRFKDINDTLGHQAGDELLRTVGDRLRAVLQARGTVARLGGDEFGLVLPRVEGTAAGQVARRVLGALEEPLQLSSLSVDVEASIGIALHPEHGRDPDTLLRRADTAMYVAKRAHSGHELYTAAQDRHSPSRLALLGRLRRAIEQEHLLLYYQPKAALPGGEVVGVEALLRWQDPETGLIPPGEFIPLAEHTGLMGPITTYVLRRALQQCRTWRDAGVRLSVAVNVSARNLHDVRLPDRVAELLDECAVCPSGLLLEITENTIMADPLRAVEVLRRLNAMGVQLAIDDFGTGISSLANLRRLPVHELKIDKSFVLNMTADADDAAIVRSTIDLGRNLRMRVVAEGVEDAATWQHLAAMGCDLAQGYYLTRPVPADELTSWLDRPQDAQSRA